MDLQELKTQIDKLVHGLSPELDLSRYSIGFSADPKFGDLALNAALVYAKELGRSPRELAEKLALLIKNEVSGIEKADVAGPGFVNLTLSEGLLGRLAVTAAEAQPTGYQGHVVVAEYGDPNPFKVLHAGHLYTSVVGDAIANLMEAAGGQVHRVNFGGDVGLHVGRTMWAILKQLGGENPDKLEEVPVDGRPEWMARAYVEGTNAYEDNEAAKREMVELNRRIYQIHAENDKSSPLAQIYWTCRKWSYDYFEQFYASIGTKFEKVYPESAVSELGLRTVQRELEEGVFERSDGAVIFDGEKYGLHKRVFINSMGIPTYEAKDVGLIMQKWSDYHFDRSVVITGNEQEQYMAVVLKAVEQFAPKLALASTHLTHDMVKLQGGVKMSSRKGNILRAADVLAAARDANRRLTGKDDEDTVLGAVKYAFLKFRMGGDLVYDPEESVSLEGNSGPYLQYAHARARSILAKAGRERPKVAINNMVEGERVLARKLIEFPEVLQQAVKELAPHVVCTYMYELAQVFNRFYEGNRVIGDEREAERLGLVKSYADVLRRGLNLMGIASPDRL